MDTVMEHIKKVFIDLKRNNQKITMLTCYDYCFSKLMDGLVDLILIGDSMGMVVYGDKNTKDVTIEMMERHTKAVARGAKRSHVVADMPINTYNSPDDAVFNARKLIEAGASSVKIEGNWPGVVSALNRNNIPVMGHIGLTPQSAEKYCVQGKSPEDAQRIIEEAVSLEEAGCYSIVLECVPKDLAKQITEKISIPTIGIGAGVYCDGQVLVTQDMLGLFVDLRLKFLKKYGDVGEEIKKAVNSYANEVKAGKFPTDEHSFN